jgi:hypothetical protein
MRPPLQTVVCTHIVDLQDERPRGPKAGLVYTHVSTLSAKAISRSYSPPSAPCAAVRNARIAANSEVSFALCAIGCRRWPKFIEVVSGCGPANSIQRRRPPFCRRRDRRRQMRPYVIATPMACSLIAVCPAIVNVIV